MRIRCSYTDQKWEYTVVYVCKFLEAVLRVTTHQSWRLKASQQCEWNKVTPEKKKVLKKTQDITRVYKRDLLQ